MSRLSASWTRTATLYAFARAARAQVLCLAHVTNTMGMAGEDFEKGEADGTRDALAILERTVTALQKSLP
jgi:alpha-D-ribose 1-methylphosphonate 5-triphosphate synthase subunit PhnG